MTASNTCRVLLLRCRLGLKVLWRDKGSRYSFLGVLGLICFWLVTELGFKGGADENYDFKSDPNNRIMIGVYVGSLLACAVRISLIEYLIEKRKKMFSFLHCLGMSKVSYYSYHVFWNFVISLIMIIPFLVAISFILGSSVSDSWTVLVFVSALGCLANSLYIMSLASFFTSEVTGLNVIGTVNFVISVVSSMISVEGSLSWILNLNPQSKLVKMVELYAMAPQQDRPLDWTGYMQTFACNIAAYFLCFVLIQNLTRNEYGYYPKDSLWNKYQQCRKKSVTQPAVGSQGNARSSTELSQIYTSNSPRDLELSSVQLPVGAQGSRPRSGRDTEAGEFEEDTSKINTSKLNTSDDEPEHFRSDSDVALSIKEIKKTFGSNSVLDGVSFNLGKGEILCLLGANGAGKSTLFNIILDNITPDSGSITSPLGENRISYCPQHDLGWEYLTIEEHFCVIEAIQEGIQTLPAGFGDRIKELTMLGNQWDTWCKNLSGGYKRRLTLALSLLSNAPVLLMDEPTTALDMEIRYSMMKGITSIRDTLRTTILYTTHHLEDAENFSDSILILSKGTVLLQGSIETLRQQFNVLTLKLYNVDAGSRTLVESYIQTHMFCETEVKPDGPSGLTVRVGDCSLEALIELVTFLEQKLKITVDIRQTSLEDVYVMDGQFDNYGAVEAVGKIDMNYYLTITSICPYLLVDMDDCWKKLIAVKREPKYAKLLWLMLQKNLKISMRDSTYSTKVIIGAALPLLIVFLFAQQFNSSNSGAKKQLNNSIMSIQNLHPYIFVAAVEFSLLAFMSTGCIFRVSDHESNILQFLFVSKGSKWAYRLANVIYDKLELTLIILTSLVGTKLLTVGQLNFSLLDWSLAGLLLVHNLGKVLILGYPISYLFNVKKTFLSYFNLLNMMGSVLLISGTIYSFSHLQERKTVLLSLLNYLNFTKICANCAIAMIPDKHREAVVFRDSVVEDWGGAGYNFIILCIHLVVFIEVNILLDHFKYCVRKEHQEREEKPSSVDSIRNQQELTDEKDYVVNTLPQISVIGAEKTYSNGFVAARDITFGVETNKIFTLLGPNGAGKSSILDVLTGISNRTGGEIVYEGDRIERYRMRSLGFCLQKNYLWEYLTFEEHLRIIAAWRGIDSETTNQLVSDVDKGLDIGKNLHIKATHLSGGNKRKLNTVLALLSAPRIYILDEPTAGMDPKSRRYFWNILKTWKQKSNCALILTTHTANEAEELSDKVGIMVNSEMIRINELVKITSSGFIVKLHSTAKIPGTWPQIIEDFTQHIKQAVKDVFEADSAEVPLDPSILSKQLEVVKLLQHNESTRATFQIPFCNAFGSLHSLMRVCAVFCERVATTYGNVQPRDGPHWRVGFSAGRMSLEQAFLAYASHQNERTDN